MNVLFNDKGQSILNSYCAQWRDGREALSVTNQMKKLAACMGQDCVQSLENSNACRWLDGQELCYAYDTAQTWCTEHPTSSYCTDAGPDAAAPPWGSAASAELSEWMPKQNVPVFNPGPDDPTHFSCSCMKHCACTSKKCYCMDPNTTPSPPAPGGDPTIGNTNMNPSGLSTKRGECTCTCGGVWPK